LNIENSKSRESNKSLHTTKVDAYSHRRWISSVRRVVKKYNGSVNFTDKGNSFEVVVLLYGIEVMRREGKLTGKPEDTDGAVIKQQRKGIFDLSWSDNIPGSHIYGQGYADWRVVCFRRNTDARIIVALVSRPTIAEMRKPPLRMKLYLLD
jgi:hypothetical protein